jgi:hypothetical protein
MDQTTIYLSVIRGKDALTLDGHLYLFKEFLQTLRITTNTFEIDSAPINTLPTEAESKQGECDAAH